MSDDWITQNYQIDRYGLALMMIREGCANPAGLARRVLAEFDGSSTVIPDPPKPRRADAMIDERRDQIIQLIGYRFGAMVSGNNMPHMSGDPRARIHPSRRRHFDDACADCADAILAIFKPSEG